LPYPNPSKAATLLRVAEERGLEGIVSKRRLAFIWCANDWVKLKTTAKREGNREQWRLFERN
jgi:ATP-dependent DNA ligase